MIKLLLKIASFSIISFCIISNSDAQRQMENLNRGLLAVRANTNQVFVSWRLLATDDSTVSFNLYRGNTKLNSSPITGATNYVDNITTNNVYKVKKVINDIEQASFSDTAVVWSQFYKTISLRVPPAGVTPPYSVTNNSTLESYPSGQSYKYTPNDCSVGDVDGDGEYEIIVKWDPSNSRDNSHGGYTGKVYLDAYKLSGTFLWRIDLGINIRAGAHYTQFMVYDLDGDGKAEVACKTAPGTKDGLGHFLTGAAVGANNAADYRTTGSWPGFVSSGPEYLTVFNGQTGAEIETILYEPNRDPANGWGKSTETTNRVDRFLACIAYLDGKKPSLVMCRGYYGRSVLVAYDFSNGKLTKKWKFDSNTSGNSAYAGQGNHNLCVGDVDGDGSDEIVYGACTIDHNGTGKYTTGLGHGDALHLGDFDPDRPGFEVWQAHEGGSGATFRDANTGRVLWKFSSSADVGRGMAADVSASKKGAECWASGSVLYSAKGDTVSASQPASDNFGVWWDGDDLREILDGDKLDKYGTGRLVTLYNYAGATYCNGTKRNPNLQADILGDWREEVILHADSSKLLVFATTASTSRRLYTLMHDPMYRLGIAWQNVAYNQPPDVSFYLGGGMSAPPSPLIIYPQFITFDTIPDKKVGDTLFTLHAVASSGLPVSYISSNPNVASVNGDTVTIVGEGTAIITASQAGNSIYMTAANVQQTITVAAAPVTPTLSQALTMHNIKIYPNPFRDLINVSFNAGFKLSHLEIINNNGIIVYTQTIKEENAFTGIDLSSLPQGVYLIRLVADNTLVIRKIVKN